MSNETLARAADAARALLRSSHVPTPALVVDIDRIAHRACGMRAAIASRPSSSLLVSTEHVRSPAVWRTLDRLGVEFQAATDADARRLVLHEIAADRIRLAGRPAGDGRGLVGFAAVRVRSAAHLEEQLECHIRPEVEIAVDLGGDPGAGPTADETMLLLKDADRAGLDRVALHVRLDVDHALVASDELVDLLDQSPVAIGTVTIEPAKGFDPVGLGGLVGEVLDGHGVERVFTDVSMDLLDGSLVQLVGVSDVWRSGGRRVVLVDGDLPSRSVPRPLSFDRELEVVESTLVCPSNADAAALEIEVPVDMSPGELLAFPAESEAGLDGCQVLIESSSHRGSDTHDVVRHGEPDFAALEALEHACFEAAGLLGNDGTLQERRFGARSRLLVVRDDRGEVSGVSRIVDASLLGFETLHSAPLDPSGMAFLQRLDLRSCVEVVTLAPVDRDPIAAYQLYLAVMLDCLRRGKTMILASMVEPVWQGVNRHLGIDGYGPFVPIGDTHIDGFTPVTLDVWQCQQRLDLVVSLERLIARLTARRARRRQRTG